MHRATSNAINRVLDVQRRWARSQGIEIDSKDRTFHLDENLFQSLHPDTYREFAAGSGNELDGDLRSLRSSAALACNVFDRWCGRELGPIASACGADPKVANLSFERTFPTGLGGTPPHLDVVLDGPGAQPTAIESKFTEIFDPADNKFRASYFTKAGLWKSLPRSLALAESLDSGEHTFERLGAAQLLKHALGLSQAFGPKGFRLLYLWYEVPGHASEQHKSEIRSFKEAIRGDFECATLTHQEVFQRLVQQEINDRAYLEYLSARYFGIEVQSEAV